MLTDKSVRCPARASACLCLPDCLMPPQVWACETLREQFLALPFSAVRCLLGSESTAVAAENTVLVALTGWVEEGSHGRSTTAAQRKELLGLVSLSVSKGRVCSSLCHVCRL